MNKKILALAIVLVVVLVGAGVAYRALTTDTAETQVKQSQETSGNSGGKTAKRQAPDFSVLDAEGKQVSLSSLRGKPVVLNFGLAGAGLVGKKCPIFSRYIRYTRDACIL